MGWLADLLKEIPSAARYKAELEELASEHDALKAENGSLKTENKNLRTELQQRAAQIHSLGVAAQKKQSEDRPQEEHDILVLLSKHERLTEQQVADHIGSKQKARLLLDRLKEPELVYARLGGFNSGDPTRYMLDDAGRAYLADRNLL
jgi:regulator of replication initiation timing